MALDLESRGRAFQFTITEEDLNVINLHKPGTLVVNCFGPQAMSARHDHVAFTIKQARVLPRADIVMGRYEDPRRFFLQVPEAARNRLIGKTLSRTNPNMTMEIETLEGETVRCGLHWVPE